jgi:DHA3 family macrolide efflux protein-like MFS transporter
MENKKQESSYKALISETKYIRLLAANAINRLGDSIDLIAFEWLAYLLTGSAAWVALILGLNFIPNVILAPFAGALVENFNLKRIMVLADFVRVIIVTAEIILFTFNLLTPWLLIVATLMISSVEQFRIPASQTTRVRLLPKEKFNVAIAANTSISSLCQLIGIGLGGLLVSITPTVALTADAFLMLCSAITLLKLRGDFSPVDRTKLSIKSYFTSLSGGFKYLFSKKELLFLACFGAGMNIWVQPFSAYMPSYIGDVLKLGAWGLSLFSAGCMFGQIVGSILAPKLRSKLGFRYTALITSITLGVCLLASWWYPRLNFGAIGNGIFISSLSVIFCLPVGVLMVIYSSIFFENIDDTYVARVSSSFGAISSASIPVSSFICAALASVLPITTVFLIFAPFQFLFFATVFIPKSIKKLDGAGK